MKLIVCTDGGARGNPGPAAIGFSIQHNGQEIAHGKKVLGITTNNVAEYQAVIEALQFLLDHHQPSQLDFYLDSQLVVNQLTGRYKLKSPHLKPLKEKIDTLVHACSAQGVERVTFTYIPREQNKRADELVNMALDEQ